MSEVTDGRRGSRTTLQGTLPPFGQVPLWVIKQQPSPAAICCYVVLSYHSLGGQREAFPSIDTLVDETGLSVASVKRGLADLRDRGIIEGTRRKSARGGYTSTAYTVHFLEPAQGSQLELTSDDWEDEQADSAELSHRPSGAQEQTLNPNSTGSEPSQRGVAEPSPEERTLLEEREGAVPTEPESATHSRRRAPYSRQQRLCGAVVASLFGGNATPSQLRMAGKAAIELAAVDFDPEEVAELVAYLRATYGNVTPTALVTHWNDDRSLRPTASRNGSGKMNVTEMLSYADELDRRAARGAQR